MGGALAFRSGKDRDEEADRDGGVGRDAGGSRRAERAAGVRAGSSADHAHAETANPRAPGGRRSSRCDPAPGVLRSSRRALTGRRRRHVRGLLGRFRRTAQARVLRRASARSMARSSAIRRAIAIVAGSRGRYCRGCLSRRATTIRTTPRWASGRRPQSTGGSAMDPTCCWSDSATAASSTSSWRERDRVEVHGPREAGEPDMPSDDVATDPTPD